MVMGIEDQINLWLPLDLSALEVPTPTPDLKTARIHYPATVSTSMLYVVAVVAGLFTSRIARAAPSNTRARLKMLLIQSKKNMVLTTGNTIHASGCPITKLIVP